MNERRSVSARLLAAIPLLTLYFGLAALYAWQASRHPVPTIYSDEIELAWLSRSIAETGEAARRGDPYGLATLVAYFLAPVWWVGSAATGYAAAKLLLVLAMTATVFPAYALARLVVPPWYALAAAGGATIVPALAYSPILVEEPLAYPLATLALWLIARVYVEPTWGRAGLAVLACTAAMLTRTQLSILFALYVLGLLWLCWQSERSRTGARRSRLGLGRARHARSRCRRRHVRASRATFPRAGAIRPARIRSGFSSTRPGRRALSRSASGSFRSSRASRHSQGREARRRDPKTRAFVITGVFALVVFVAYAGIKGAQISITFSTLVVERNLIYLCPILFAATALAFVRGVGRGWAIAGATVFTVYVVTEVPLRLDNYPYYEAHGLSMPAFLNREWGWPEGRIESTLLDRVLRLRRRSLVALRYLRRGSRVFTAVAASAAVAVFAWSLTAEVYAAEGERRLARQIADNLPAPYDWVDRATGGGSVVILGQQMTDDPTGVYLTEFFNRSVKKVWSTDGTAPGPGAILTPDLASADGTLTPSPGTEYALTLNGVELQAPVVKRLGPYVLYDIDREPLKLASGVNGIDRDGWIADTDGTASQRRRTTVSTSRVTDLDSHRSTSRGSPGARADAPAQGDGSHRADRDRCRRPAGDRQGHTGADEDGDTVHATGFSARRAERVPWRIEVEITPTFSPHDLDPNHSDRRQLGAVFTAGFQPLFER